jgi:hypothetical protein
MLQEEELKGAPVLILANKQDMPNAMNELEVSTSFLSLFIFSKDLQWTWINRYKKQEVVIVQGLCQGRHWLKRKF